LLAELMPIGTKGAIVAIYKEDTSDMQSDYFGSREVRAVLLGFSGHNRDIFSEMRKIAKASGFEEVQHLTGDDKKQEHRQKYSMGAGYFLKGGYRHDTGWEIRKYDLQGSHYVDQLALIIMEEGGNQLPKTDAKPEQAPKEQATSTSALCELRENPNKNGIELIFTAKPSAEIRDRLKNTGFRWHRKYGFWYAKDHEQQRLLAEELAGQAVEQTAKSTRPKGETLIKENGDKLRAMADKMTAQIDGKFNSGVSQQNPTARRARIAESMRKDGERLQKIQSVLYGLANDIEAGTLPDCLKAIRSKAVIADILDNAARASYHPEGWKWYGTDRTKKAGVKESNSAEVMAALEAYIKPPTEAEIKARTIAELERELIGCKIDGFFPTPRPVIDLMIERAAIEESNTILEPSAGKGDIADAIKELWPNAYLKTVEVNSTLRKILKAKGHDLGGWDFLDVDFWRNCSPFDRIIMNPPFEKMADIDHIKRAFEMLNDGGRVVCLMSESPFFRTDAKAVEFREWLEDVNGCAEKLEEGSFKGAESFRQTGVNARMVTIDK